MPDLCFHVELDEFEGVGTSKPKDVGSSSALPAIGGNPGGNRAAISLRPLSRRSSTLTKMTISERGWNPFDDWSHRTG